MFGLGAKLLGYTSLGLAGVSLALGLALAVQTHRITRLKADLINPATGAKWQTEAKRDGKLLTAAVRDLGTCHTNVETLNTALETQASAVAAIKADSASRIARSEKASRDARGVAESLRREAETILAEQPGADRCRSASELIRESVG